MKGRGLWRLRLRILKADLTWVELGDLGRFPLFKGPNNLGSILMGPNFPPVGP